MKWQITDVKKNPGTGKEQKYNITLNTTQNSNKLLVEASVSSCPRGQRPTRWHEGNIIQWLSDKGIKVVETIKKDVLTDIGTCKAEYSFRLPTVKATTTKASRKNSRKRTTKQSTLNITTTDTTETE